MLTVIVALCLCATSALAFGHRSAVTNNWYLVYLGGGGETVRGDWPSHTIQLMSADTQLCYIYSPTWGAWYPIPNTTAFASITATPHVGQGIGVGFNPSTGGSQLWGQTDPSNSGCFEIRGAPSAPSVAYVWWQTDLYVSVNIDPLAPEHITWTSTGAGAAGINGYSAGALLAPAANGKAAGPAMAVDPFSPDHVILCTYTQGCWETLTGRSASPSWQQFTTGGSGALTPIPTLSTGGNVAYSVVFDPTVSQSGLARRAYVAVSGTGIYVADNIGSAGSFNAATWNLTNGGTGSMPSNNFYDIAVNPGGNGNNAGLLYVISGTAANISAGGSGNLNVYTPGSLGTSQNGTWVSISSLNTLANHVAVNPSDGNYVIVSNGSLNTVYASTGGGGTPTFTTYTLNQNGLVVANANAPGWLTLLGTNGSLTNGFIRFDPTGGAPGTLWASGGQGMWTMPFPNANFNMTAFSNATHQLGSGSVLWGGHTAAGQARFMITAQDQQGCSFLVPANSYPTTCWRFTNGPGGGSGGLGASYKPGTSRDGSTQAANSGQNQAGLTPNISGISTDGFVTDWRPFNNGFVNQTVAASQIVNNSGNPQITNINTTNLTSWSNGSGDFLCGYVNQRPLPNTVASGVVWNTPTQMQCFPLHVDVNDPAVGAVSFNTAGGSITYNANMSSALYAQGYTFWKLPTSFLSNASGAWTVINVTNNGSNAVRLTLAGTGAVNGCCNMTVGDPVFVSGVTMTGASTVNGLWRISAVSATGYPMTVDLTGSSFAVSDTYVSGGVASTTMGTGGSQVSISDANNMVYLPGGATVSGPGGLPKCTTNGGATWTDLNIQPTALTTVSGSFSAGSTAITVASGAAVPTSTVGYIVQLDSGRLMKTSVTTSGNTMTMTNAVPPGDGLTTSNPIYTAAAPIVQNTGAAQQMMDRDWVAPATFYIYVQGGGMWNIGPGCKPVNVAGTAAPVRSFANSASQYLQSVVGETGHLLWASGVANLVITQAQPLASNMARSCDGGLTWWIMPNTFGASGAATGAPMPGFSYPAIYFQGWYDADGSNSGSDTHNTFSVWRMADDPNHGLNGHCVTGGTGTGGTSGSPSNTITIATFTTTGQGAGNLGIGATLVFVNGVSVPAGTKIDGMSGAGVGCSPSACTGAGGTGTYHLNNSVTIAGTPNLVFQSGTWVNLCPSGQTNSLQGTAATICFPGLVGTPGRLAADPWVPGLIAVGTTVGVFYGGFN